MSRRRRKWTSGKCIGSEGWRIVCRRRWRLQRHVFFILWTTSYHMHDTARVVCPWGCAEAASLTYFLLSVARARRPDEGIFQVPEADCLARAAAAHVCATARPFWPAGTCRHVGPTASFPAWQLGEARRPEAAHQHCGEHLFFLCPRVLLPTHSNRGPLSHWFAAPSWWAGLRPARPVRPLCRDSPWRHKQILLSQAAERESKTDAFRCCLQSLQAARGALRKCQKLVVTETFDEVPWHTVTADRELWNALELKLLHRVPRETRAHREARLHDD